MKRSFNIERRRDIFARRLSESMASKGITQTAMAKFLDTTQQTVSRWCKGACEPDYDTLVLLCGLLDETPDELLAFDENDSKRYVALVMRDVVGNDKEFKRRQREIADKVVKREITDAEGARLDKELFDTFYAEYCKQFDFGGNH